MSKFWLESNFATSWARRRVRREISAIDVICISDIIAGRQDEVSFGSPLAAPSTHTHKSAPRAPLSLLLFLLSTRWEKEEKTKEMRLRRLRRSARSKVEDLIGWCVFNAKTHVTSLINSLVAAAILITHSAHSRAPPPSIFTEVFARVPRPPAVGLKRTTPPAESLSRFKILRRKIRFCFS